MTEMMEFFREAGRRGGKKRAANLTAEQQSAIGKKAAEARWGKKRAKKKAVAALRDRLAKWE